MVDHRLEPIHGDGAIHGQKMGTVAQGDAPQREEVPGEGADIDR